jgi:glutaredoxin
MAARSFTLVLGVVSLGLLGVVVSRWPHAQHSVAAQTSAEARLPARGVRSSPSKPPEPPVAVPQPASSPTVSPASVPVAPAARVRQAPVPDVPAKVLAAEDAERTHAQVMAAIAAREHEQRRAMGALNIEMYSTTWCGACKAARLYMQDHGIAFTDHDVEADPDARTTQLSLNPRGSVPTIDVDGREVLVGFSGSNLEAALARATAARSGT